MTLVGVDLEQFIRDPYATGIQRVLQQLALFWPEDISAGFVVPDDEGAFLLLSPEQAAALLTLPFSEQAPDQPEADRGHDLRMAVSMAMAALRSDRSVPRLTLGDLLSVIDSWLLPEVSYLPSVLERLAFFRRCVPVTMIGYDALPMTEPGNYRFVPGSGGWVSEYFRHLAGVDAVVCISEMTRTTILDRLRRDRSLRTLVAHPGGDHVPAMPPQESRSDRPVFLRVGTMEARKRPLEILRGFTLAVESGVDAELVFVGNPNASTSVINDEVLASIDRGLPVRWVRDASDADVRRWIRDADAFLSFGIEGYGIPVLEAIRLGGVVLYGGVQPAGDLMEGRGARRVQGDTVEELAGVFRAAASTGLLAELRRQRDPHAVPAWRDFSAAVARACVGHR